jgi:hypothetical protein
MPSINPHSLGETRFFPWKKSVLPESEMTASEDEFELTGDSAWTLDGGKLKTLIQC